MTFNSKEAPQKRGFRVILCNYDDVSRNQLITLATHSGQSPYREGNLVCIDVLVPEPCWRADDAVFDRIESGTYVFKD